MRAKPNPGIVSAFKWITAMESSVAVACGATGARNDGWHILSRACVHLLYRNRPPYVGWRGRVVSTRLSQKRAFWQSMDGVEKSGREPRK